MAYTSGCTVLLSCPGRDVLFAPCDDGKQAKQVHFVAGGSLAAIVRSSGLTMYFKAAVGVVPAACLMSPCCTNILMSASYARQMGITVEPYVGEPLQAAVADGSIHASTRTCKVLLKMQRFSADLQRHVVELSDIMMGSWMLISHPW